MRIENYVNYGCFLYESKVSGADAYRLGDVVINEYNEVGVVIQMHDRVEFRTDMFGNTSDDEVRLATDKEISLYRPNILQEGHFKHDTPVTPEYIAVRHDFKVGNRIFNTTDVFNDTTGDKVCTFPYNVRQPKYGSKAVMINGWKHPITSWMKA